MAATRGRRRRMGSSGALSLRRCRMKVGAAGAPDAPSALRPSRSPAIIPSPFSGTFWLCTESPMVTILGAPCLADREPRLARQCLPADAVSLVWEGGRRQGSRDGATPAKPCSWRGPGGVEAAPGERSGKVGGAWLLLSPEDYVL